MEFMPVISSSIVAVAYDNVQNELHVQFVGNESIYKYYGVPLEVFEEMMASDSVGRYYARNIKRNYRGQVGDRRDG